MKIPIRVRLTAWYAFMLTLILFALGGFISFELRRDLQAGVDTELNICTTVLIHALWDAENDPESGDLSLRETLEEDLLEAAQAALPQGTSAVQLVDEQGTCARQLRPRGIDHDVDCTRNSPAGGQRAADADHTSRGR